MALRHPTEHEEQASFFKEVRLREVGDPRYRMIFAIPNAGKRGPRASSMMKSEGLRAGVWDVFVAVPSGDFHGLFIEMKRGRPYKGKLTDEQDRFGELADAFGYACVICYSADEASRAVRAYFEKKLH